MAHISVAIACVTAHSKPIAGQILENPLLNPSGRHRGNHLAAKLRFLLVNLPVPEGIMFARPLCYTVSMLNPGSNLRPVVGPAVHTLLVLPLGLNQLLADFQ